MQLSWKVILGPIVGALIGWLTTKTGISFGPQFNDGVVALGAFVFTLAGHVWEEKTQASKVGTTTLNVSTPPKQGGFIRLSMLIMMLAVMCVVSAALQLGACSALPAPQTFNQKVYVGYGAVDTIAKSADALLTQGKLSKPAALNIAAQAANLKAALDIARTTYATNQTDGGNQLTTALTAINALTTYIEGLQ